MLFLIHDLRVGGAERVFLQYLRSLRGVRPIPVLVRPIGAVGSDVLGDLPTYHLEGGGDVPRPAAALLGQHGPVPGALPAQGLVAGVSSMLAKSRRLARIAERESAELVSTFLHKSHILALMAALIWNRDLKVVVNFHEQPLQHLRFHFEAGARLLMRMNYRWLLPRADRIVVVADGIGEELIRLGIPEGRIVRVRNPIDVEALQSRGRAEPDPSDAADALEESPPLLVGVGRLERIKGFDLLIRAVGQLVRTRPVRLILVGEGSERVRLQRLVAELDLEDCVRLVGYRENPLPLMGRADVLVVPSRTEAWPTVIGEGLAVGTPILATRCSPGVGEFLGEGRLGVLVVPGSARALAEGLEGLLADADRLRELAVGGPLRAAEFSSARVVSLYESVLGSQLRGHGRGRA